MHQMFNLSDYVYLYTMSQKYLYAKKIVLSLPTNCKLTRDKTTLKLLKCIYK
jgi:hypothetical protein